MEDNNVSTDYVYSFDVQAITINPNSYRSVQSQEPIMRRTSTTNQTQINHRFRGDTPLVIEAKFHVNTNECLMLLIINFCLDKYKSHAQSQVYCMLLPLVLLSKFA